MPRLTPARSARVAGAAASAARAARAAAARPALAVTRVVAQAARAARAVRALARWLAAARLAPGGALSASTGGAVFGDAPGAAGAAGAGTHAQRGQRRAQRVWGPVPTTRWCGRTGGAMHLIHLIGVRIVLCERQHTKKVCLKGKISDPLLLIITRVLAIFIAPVPAVTPTRVGAYGYVWLPGAPGIKQ